MEYRLLDNGVGVILTRQPKIAEGELLVSFAGAPADSTAIFETESGDCYYRKLSDGACSLPVSKIFGEVKVTVALLNGKTPTRRWLCEEIKAENQNSGCALIAPNDMNLPQTVVELRLENQEIRQTQEELKKLCKELKDTLEKIMEGYDFT